MLCYLHQWLISVTNSPLAFLYNKQWYNNLLISSLIMLLNSLFLVGVVHGVTVITAKVP